MLLLFASTLEMEVLSFPHKIQPHHECGPFLCFLTAPVHTRAAATRPHPITHAHKPNTPLTSSLIHPCVIGCLLLSYEATFSFFNHSLLLTLFFGGVLCGLKIAVLCFYD